MPLSSELLARGVARGCRDRIEIAREEACARLGITYDPNNSRKETFLIEQIHARIPLLAAAATAAVVVINDVVSNSR